MNSVRETLTYAEKLGFTVTKTKHNHFKYKGFGHTVIGSSTSCNKRAIIIIRKSLEKIVKGTFISHT